MPMYFKNGCLRYLFIFSLIFSDHTTFKVTSSNMKPRNKTEYVYVYTSHIFSSVTVIDWILPVVSPSWAGQWCRHATHYPTQPETPGSLGWTASGRPTGLVGSTCYLTPFFITTTTIVTTSSLGSSCTVTRNPCGAIVTGSPGSWVAIFWNKTLLVLTGEFDADNGGYGKQNASSYWVMFLKILLLIKGLNM